jgi:hypothetical protein
MTPIGDAGELLSSIRPVNAQHADVHAIGTDVCVWFPFRHVGRRDPSIPNPNICYCFLASY